MNIWKYMTIAALTVSHSAYAHGEDTPGPHNGFIKMPGSYHIEVIPGKNSVDIMLLDANLKNPTVLNSHIKVKIKHGTNAYVLRCESMENYFTCPVSEKVLSREGTLVIQSARQLAEGNTMEYPLPLKLAEEKQSA